MAIHQHAIGLVCASSPVGVTYVNYIWNMSQNGQITQLGTYQALSTRAFGEVVSSDQY